MLGRLRGIALGHACGMPRAGTNIAANEGEVCCGSKLHLRKQLAVVGSGLEMRAPSQRYFRFRSRNKDVIELLLQYNVS